ncbi:tRNA lysidine(34) synthetase TilS [Rheinheimera maricola]|uniref:tRNA(Ile)-lysidine synthase n=1 Tax=Rheinheimera maricola TaxID=2793282 RepID=A0ABS7XB84_9GAMM|nr:tRNA lysidine(34) synthetase TilS [Rheinheimera maricola]MBZ9612820.1 tRNA lysidine(34) synthetase TilS [Rheinheimera maricola]
MAELSPQYLLDTLAPLADNQLVLAFSGGLDSMVLLHLLSLAQKQHSFSLKAVYINHGISAHANHWADFCKAQCDALGVAFAQQAVVITGQSNLEQKARIARYQALAQYVSTDKHMLLSAHHADDQIESLLLALKRGAGGAGLSGIAAKRPFAAGMLCRPLLVFSRSELEHYAVANKLSWVNDDSNSDCRFERNFIRQHLTPVIKARWPQFQQTATRSMQHIAQLQQLAEHYTRQALAQCVSDAGLLLQPLAELLPLQQDLVLRQWLADFGLNPETQWLTTLKQQVIAARPDAEPLLVLADYQLRRFANTLYVLKPIDVQTPTQTLTWQGEPELALPDDCGCLYISATKQADAIALSATRGQWVFGQLSRRFKPAGAAMSKPLKQWFKLWQVPPWQRLRVPLLLVNGELVAVAGYASSTAPELATAWLHWQR